jgi:hypothetical protein
MLRTPVAAAAFFVVAMTTATGCGSDGSSSSGTDAGATTVAPESVIVSAEAVTAGLKKMPATIQSAIAAIGTPDAEAKLEAIEAEWAGFEGKVRQTDAELYIAIEDQLTPLQRAIKAGDAAKASTTAQALDALFAKYMAANP